MVTVRLSRSTGITDLIITRAVSVSRSAVAELRRALFIMDLGVGGYKYRSTNSGSSSTNGASIMPTPAEASNHTIGYQHLSPTKESSKFQWSTICHQRFTNRKARDTVYAARRQLRHCSTPTYINEDLTKPTAELFSQTRKLVKTKRVHAAWTTGGNIYYKLSDQPNCKPKLVRSASDLP